MSENRDGKMCPVIAFFTAFLLMQVAEHHKFKFKWKLQNIKKLNLNASCKTP